MAEHLFLKYIECGGGAELGEPRAPEQVEPDGQFRYREFQGGSIYWTPQTGAKLVDEKILSCWLHMSVQDRSKLGYPIGDRTQDRSRVYNRFQGGTISYSLYNGKCEAYFDRSGSRDIQRKIFIGIVVGVWLILAFIIYLKSEAGIGQGILTVVTGIFGPLTTILIDHFLERSHSYEGQSD